MIDLNGEEKEVRIDSSLEIFISIKNNKDYLVRPDKWWVERAIMTELLFIKKNMRQLIKLQATLTR